MAIERPSYRVVSTFDQVEVREYPQLLVAETTVEADRDEASTLGFRTLAAYIFGANHARSAIAMTAPVTQAPGQPIEMTAPVTQAREGKRWVIQFTMPSSFTSLEQLPVPNDSSVRLRVVPPRTVAVVTYTGVWSESLYAKHLATLRDGVLKAGLKPLGAPVFARYDPPWKPWFLRTNEVQVEVAIP